MMSSRQYPPRAMSCLAVQLLLLGALFLPAKAQNPLSLELVMKAIESGTPPQPELARRISESGVSFSLDSQTRDLLMKKGAKAPLIQAIENARTARSSQGGTPNADVTVFSGEAIAGDEGPVTRERIFAVLRGNQDQALLAGLVSQYGIAFPFTPELGQEFRNVGANEVLLAELATAKVSTGAPDDSFIPLPLAKAQDYNGSEQSGRLDIR
ncbi:MAG: hypothetical protein LC114_02390, partial [Bryobacterales bacterium]|nr:hypothetical protein [Bryobacterales bacterium]